MGRSVMDARPENRLVQGTHNTNYQNVVMLELCDHYYIHEHSSIDTEETVPLKAVDVNLFMW